MLKRLTTIALGAFWSLALGVSAAPTITTVALTGQQAPGTAAGVTYTMLFYKDESGSRTSYREFALNDLGQIAFRAELSGPSPVPGWQDQGIWSTASGAATLLVRTGDYDSATSGKLTDFHRSMAVNDAGETAFIARSRRLDGTHFLGVWAGTTRYVRRLVALEGQPAPGTSNAFNSFETVNLNSLGQAVLYGAVNPYFPGGGWTNHGIWSEGGGTLAKVAKFGDEPFPSTEPGVTFCCLNAGPHALNDAGQTAFSAQLTGPGIVLGENDLGTWVHDPVDGLQLVARTGDPTPGTNPATYFAGYLFSDAQVNDAGELAFGAWTTAGFGGVWAGKPGELRLVAQGGQPAPGTDAEFLGFCPDTAINNLGRTAFRGSLIGESVDPNNDYGIWSEGSGALALVAREGEEPPGTGPGIAFSGFQYLPALSDTGQTAFHALLTGAVDETNDHGIWAQDAAGALQLVIRAGDQIEVASGDLRTVDYIPWSDSSVRWHPVLFSNSGDIAFYAAFTDGSQGLLIAHLDEEADADSDGVPDEEEQGPDGTVPDYDGDGSGIADKNEANVASLHSHDGAAYLTLATPPGTSLAQVQAIAPPEPLPTGVELPVGLLSFRIEGLLAGGETTATLYLPAGIEPNSFWKYGPTSEDPTNHWFEFLDDGTTGAVIAGNQVTLYLVDGLRGDLDLTADGKVVEPGGPVQVVEVAVPLDIRPGSCPNPLNVGSRGVLPVAIAGHPDLDVTAIDRASVRLEGVAALRTAVQDVTTPVEPFLGKTDPTACTTAGADGVPDLVLTFDTQTLVAELVAKLGRPLENREVLVLQLTGNLSEAYGGLPIRGEDVVIVLSPNR